jgi:lysophospholipase L1-like esterase
MSANEPDDIASALASYADQRPPDRTVSVRQTAAVLGIACVVALLLDSEGLLTWAQRLEVGPVQTVLLEAIAPVHGTLSAAGLASPRKWVAHGREAIAEKLGGEGDPLLAEGWTPPPVIEHLALPPRGEGRGEGPNPAPTPDAGTAPVTPPLPVVIGEGSGVLVLGDSMIAGVLGSTLEQTLARGTSLPVTRAAQLGTGLSRPDVFDWMKVVPPLLKRDRPKYVVVSLGANDATNLREGDEAVDYGTARWKQVYAARVEAMMRALTADGTRVLWLALPPMRDSRLQARATFVNGLFTQTARKVRGVEVMPLDVLVGDAEGRYATFVTEPDGRPRRYRLDDGVHLAPAGARAVSRWVLDWVRERR